LHKWGCFAPSKDEKDPVKFYQRYIREAKINYQRALKATASSKDYKSLFKEELCKIRGALGIIEEYAGRLIVNSTKTEEDNKRDEQISKLERTLDSIIIKDIYGKIKIKNPLYKN